MTFAGAEERKEFFTEYCANSEGWRSCSVAQMLERSYDTDIRR